MYEQVEKRKENESRAVANSTRQKKSKESIGTGFIDNRPEATVQRMVRKTAYNPTDSRQLPNIDDNYSSQPIQMLPANVSALLDQVANQDPSMVNAKFYVAAVSDWLTHNGLSHRLGGSLSARLQGANRRPRDVDIETQDATGLQRAYILVSGMNGSVTINGNTATCNVLSSQIQTGVFAQVRLQFTAPDNSSIIVDVDIVNENNPTFNQHIRSPQSRGVAAVSGDLVSAPELVMNYLDRIVKKPAIATTKEDHKQVLQILRANGFNPSSQSDIQSLRNSIASIAQPTALQGYLNVLERVINWGLANQF